MSTPSLDSLKVICERQIKNSPIQVRNNESDAQHFLKIPRVPQKLKVIASVFIRDAMSAGTLHNEQKCIQNLEISRRLAGGSENTSTIRSNEYKLFSVHSTSEAPRAKLTSQQIANNVHEKGRKKTSEGRYQKLLEAKSQKQETKVFLYPLEITDGPEGDYRARQPTGVLSLPGQPRLSIRHKSMKNGDVYNHASDLPRVVEYVPQLSPLVLEERRLAAKCDEKDVSEDAAEKTEPEKKEDKASASTINEQKQVQSED